MIYALLIRTCKNCQIFTRNKTKYFGLCLYFEVSNKRANIYTEDLRQTKDRFMRERWRLSFLQNHERNIYCQFIQIKKYKHLDFFLGSFTIDIEIQISLTWIHHSIHLQIHLTLPHSCQGSLVSDSPENSRIMVAEELFWIKIYFCGNILHSSSLSLDFQLPSQVLPYSKICICNKKLQTFPPSKH